MILCYHLPRCIVNSALTLLLVVHLINLLLEGLLLPVSKIPMAILLMQHVLLRTQFILNDTEVYYKTRGLKDSVI